jgi:hypothetical protein
MLLKSNNKSLVEKLIVGIFRVVFQGNGISESSVFCLENNEFISIKHLFFFYYKRQKIK